MKISDLRENYHSQICKDVLRLNVTDDKEYPNYSDCASKNSVAIGLKIIELLGCNISRNRIAEQTIGNLFERITKDFLSESFRQMDHLRPGEWTYSIHQTEISRFDQYEHLDEIEKKIKGDKELTTALGRDYLVKPDIIIAKSPVSDEVINKKGILIESNDGVSCLTPFRETNIGKKILHASISCKWTIRSDRSQNTRTEALNLIRNRKGKLPHIVAVTAEPLPTRIATLALGTGDLDCVYHFALNELSQAVELLDAEDQLDMLNIMVKGKRLRDISDLPFDLAI